MTLLNKIPPRVVIYAKDIENITGRSLRAAQVLMQNIRKATGKSRHQPITIREFCEFMGIDEELIRDFLVD